MTPTPLEADWVVAPLAITVAGRTVTGTVRANWGAVHVAVASPVPHARRSLDHRGCAFGMAATRRPEIRYAFQGEITEVGHRTAERLLTDLVLDWLAVRRHEEEVVAAYIRTRKELAAVAADFDARQKPLLAERRTLRRRFRSGDYSQRDHQRLLRDLGQESQRLNQERRDAEREVGQQFVRRLEELCGRSVSFAEVEEMLAGLGLAAAPVS